MWPSDRRKDLISLQNLLVDVSELNRGSNVIEKMQRISKIADKLLSSDMEKGKVSFMAFIIAEATKKEK